MSKGGNQAPFRFFNHHCIHLNFEQTVLRMLFLALLPSVLLDFLLLTPGDYLDEVIGDATSSFRFFPSSIDNELSAVCLDLFVFQ